MGKRGPAKQPAAFKIARGTFRRDKDGDPAAIPSFGPAVIGAPPESLGTAGRDTWLATGQKLVSGGVLESVDVPVFLRYCQAHDHVERLNKILEEQGEYFQTEQGYVGQHPAVNQRFKWIAEINRFEARFGMTASDRCGMQVATKKKTTVPGRVRA